MPAGITGQPFLTGPTLFVGKGVTQPIHPANQSWPVGNRVDHISAMDEIKGGLVGPFVLDVVDDEPNIRRDQGWLNGTQVYADDLHAR